MANQDWQSDACTAPQDLRCLALEMAIGCRPFDAECLDNLYEAILTKLREIKEDQR